LIDQLTAIMPHAEPYKHIQVKELHPTFGAEVFGVDFSQPVPDDVFDDILAAITKVGVVVSTSST
jgi:alpha-ketoglutarate-dependent 2,4-dichlorophenoxyacetate dioxygenase